MAAGSLTSQRSLAGPRRGRPGQGRRRAHAPTAVTEPGRDDPFGLRAQWDDERRHTLITSALTRAEYRHGLQLSEGHALPDLTGRVRSLLVLEGVDAAIGVADGRTRGLPWAAVPEAPAPYQWPRGACDLVLFSGIGARLTPTDLARVVDRLADALEPGGEMLALHPRAGTDDRTGGDDVHARIRRSDKLESVGRWIDADFRIEVLTRV